MKRHQGPVRELSLAMSGLVEKRVLGMGRTEDVVVSPDGRRLAIAAINDHEIVLIEHVVAESSVTLTSATRVGCASMARPHGLAWVDDHTLLVGNREAEVLILDISDAAQRVDAEGLVTVEGRVLLDGHGGVPIDSPGSVAVRSSDGELAEIVVCNNYVNRVSRHVVDVADDFACLDEELLITAGLNVPDGVAFCPAGDWIAISNHFTHEVFVYRYDDQLGPDTEPNGVLERVNYPHALRFTADGRYLLAADAGLPFVHVYHAHDGEWSGRRAPVRSVRVMDDDTFNAGRYNPQEGGPKGLEILHDAGIVIVSSQEQPLAFFDLADFTGVRLHESVAPGAATSAAIARRLARRAATAEASLLQGRQHGEWQASVIEERDRQLAALAEQLSDESRRLGGELAQLHAEVERLQLELGRATERSLEEQELRARLETALVALRSSTSWRITGPVRSLADRLRSGHQTAAGVQQVGDENGVEWGDVADGD